MIGPLLPDYAVVLWQIHVLFTGACEKQEKEESLKKRLKVLN